MPVSGYDPEDIDDTLEARLGDAELRERLTDEELDAYRSEEASLVDLLDEDEIARVLGVE
ncbi:hypothetical protein [Halostella salina]|uniref:hypothetical protein n=1 Tax=Halostella salina TaxID=1547897 RepID=UPI000EF7E81D|nr:hypothetical protein [Halostella salina]